MSFMLRDSASHKGENGKVAVIGGSRTQHGAPLLAALAAETTGVDLLFVLLPAIHEDVAKQAALNLQVHPFLENDLSPRDVRPILELLASMDSAVIGPGITRTPPALSAMEKIVAGSPCPLVLDASALQASILALFPGRTAVFTPHLGELERLNVSQEDLARTAMERHVTIHQKGVIDRIADPEGTIQEVHGGNAGLSVGGTGDVLAGLIAGFLAQRLEPPEACALASKLLKQSADTLKEERGYAYTAHDIIRRLPSALQELSPAA